MKEWEGKKEKFVDKWGNRQNGNFRIVFLHKSTIFRPYQEILIYGFGSGPFKISNGWFLTSDVFLINEGLT